MAEERGATLRDGFARVWLRAVVFSCVVEILLNMISAMEPDWAFSWRVSVVRVAVMLCAFALYRIFRCDSRIWELPLDLSVWWQRVVAVVLCSLMCASLFCVSRLSDQQSWLDRGAVYEDGIAAVQDGNQYNHLADALLSGSVKLDLPVSYVLLEMENPYDTPLRQQLNAEKQEPIYWDYAFYDGAYYCYFGALPCLLTFVPFKAITGCDLRTDYVVVLFACLMMLAALTLLYQLARLWFPGISIGAFAAGGFLLYASSGVLEQVFLPRIYPIPILSALFFAFSGLAAFVYAKRCFLQKDLMPKRVLVLGGLLMACTLGCRPQYVLSAALIVVLLWKEIRAGEFFSRRGFGNTVAVVVPFLLVAMPVCWYNYVRFGSITDFGASYNLTGADMTAYSFDPIAIIVRIMEYLFLPPQVTSTFPYIQAVNQVSGFPSCLFTNEPVFGGFFAFAPVALAVLCLFARSVRGRLALRGTLGLSLGCLVLAVAVLVVVSYVSGVTMRYYADFAWLVLIAAVLVIWEIMESERERGSVRASSWLAALTLAGLLLYLWTFLGTARFGALITTCPAVFNAAEAFLRFM